MFTAALFTIAKTWKQPKCPSTDEWIKKNMIYLYDVVLHSHEKNEIMQFTTTWMDLEIIILSEGNQTEKDKYHTMSLLGGIIYVYMCVYTYMHTNELIYKREIDPQMVTKRK